MTVLSTIGATTHPLLEKVLGDGISGGGIIFPLYENGQLENVAIRRLDNSNQMKYTLAIPDISIWGINDIKENSEIWLSEGLIDRIAMLENGFDNVISASTPGLSIIHLLKILDKKPSIVNIWSDKDQTGLKHAAIIQKFFSINNVACEVYISEESKDADDHFNRDGLTIDDIYPIKVTHERINSFPKNINGNFLEYLKGREF
jgi:DNA primase